MSSFIIKLRPHHLLCILTYVGEGYSKAFTDNFDIIIEKINSAKTSQIEIVSGPDDICAPRLCDKNDKCHCYEDSFTKADLDALNDLQSLNMNINFAIGARIHLSSDLIHDLRVKFTQGVIRTACIGCEWHSLCTDISEKTYKNTRLNSHNANQ